MLENNNYECLNKQQIIAYLSEKMTPVETHRIEKHILDCKLCEAAIQGYASQPNAFEVLNDANYFAIENMTPTINTSTSSSANVSTNVSQPVFKLKKWAWLAAACALLALPFGYHFYQNSNNSVQLAAEYGGLMPAPQVIVRGENSMASTEAEHAFSAYEQADYNASLTKFEKILATEPQNTEAALKRTSFVTNNIACFFNDLSNFIKCCLCVFHQK